MRLRSSRRKGDELREEEGEKNKDVEESKEVKKLEIKMERGGRLLEFEPMFGDEKQRG